MLANTSVIYEPKGKAGEYSKLAVNIYRGCGHRCEYCYAPAIMRTVREAFNQPAPRKDILQKIKQDSLILQSEHRTDPVLLCFTCDPYQPIDEYHQLTRQTIQILHQHNLNVTVLTKGGKRAERDFDLLTNDDWFGVTLTNLDNKLSLEWEPGAALPGERINSLQRAHEKRIKTWVSLEPVLYPETTLEIIRQTYHFVDEFKVGTLNYHPHAKTIDWPRFAGDVKRLLMSLKCSYYLKNDLRKWLG
jgi:DNA repair photolyase